MSEKNKSPVYFTPTADSESAVSVSSKLKSLFKKAGFAKLLKKDDFVALKMHLGEEKKKSFISPVFVKVIVNLVREAKAKPFVTDTNTLYESPRVNAVDHLALAAKHGFSYENLGCPVIIADGLIGENQVSMATPHGRIHIAGLAKRVDVILALSHCTGHLLTGYGGALKNISMGLAGRGGKLDMHSGVKPEIITSDCKACEVCIIHCPADAITLVSGRAYINRDICYGCGECFAVCPHKAVKVDKWHAASDSVQAKMARYCAGILFGKKTGFINFATSITKNCDCIDKPEKPLLPDVGILASSDPVAIDTASIDLINQKAGEDVFRVAWPEIDYTIQFKESEKLGVGSMKHSIV
ncbi:MAG: DUF362 domain-containing protein [Planctomycetota bacterium]